MNNKTQRRDLHINDIRKRQRKALKKPESRRRRDTSSFGSSALLLVNLRKSGLPLRSDMLYGIPKCPVVPPSHINDGISQFVRYLSSQNCHDSPTLAPTSPCSDLMRAFSQVKAELIKQHRPRAAPPHELDIKEAQLSGLELRKATGGIQWYELQRSML